MSEIINLTVTFPDPVITTLVGPRGATGATGATGAIGDALGGSADPNAEPVTGTLYRLYTQVVGGQIVRLWVCTSTDPMTWA